ncbi:thermonuclease family protein [Mycolicibacterium conceptionense]|uniref:thermonuclease family protein n=1 Tax=Mycolicibacterium conceptionense TaxID=451644 RepID=UPI0009C08397|nr:thermonuclease family protein [Mycolicibacterium conceptionense]
MVLIRRIVVLVFALGCCLLVPSCAPIVGNADPTGESNAAVVRVVDGDTVDIRHDDRGRLRIRILGINAPETHKRGWTVGCYGPESAAWASAVLPVGQRVSMVTDPTQGLTDRYGRTLAYLDLPDGRDFSAESVRAGMSQVVTYGRRPVQRFADLTAAENEAKILHAGLWGPPCSGATESVPE